LLHAPDADLPAPVLGRFTTVQDSLAAQASTTYTVEFFAADGSGQGQQFLGSVSVTTDASGRAALSAA
jgi:hypothetical protein